MKSATYTLCPVCKEKAPHWALIAGSSYYRCLSCALIFLWPPPEPEVVKSYYEGAFAVIACRKQRSEADFLRLVSSYRRGPSLLDVGAGWGDLIIEAEKMGFQCEAVEIREDCVVSLHKKGFPVFRGTFQDYHPEKRYHCVTMLHTLSTWSILQVPQTCLITPHRRWSLRAHRAQCRFLAFRIWRLYSEWFQPGGHLFHFSPSSLKNLLTREALRDRGARDEAELRPHLPGAHTLFYLPIAALKVSGLYYDVRRKVGESQWSKSRSKPPLALSLLHGYLEAANLLSLPFHHISKPLWKWYERDSWAMRLSWWPCEWHPVERTGIGSLILNYLPRAIR